jgi:hypothetical protein
MQDVVHARPSLGAAVLEDVEGFTSASPRQSLTTGAGALRVAPIDGVRYRLARPVSHHHGHLTEVFRADWGLTDSFRSMRPPHSRAASVRGEFTV